MIDFFLSPQWLRLQYALLVASIFVYGGLGRGTQVYAQELQSNGLVCSHFFAADIVDVRFRPALSVLNGLMRSAVGAKERLSVEHQHDLLRALMVPRRAAAVRELGIDLVALSMGIADSDAGKLAWSWQSAVLQPSADSDAFLDFLCGRSESVAGRTLRDLIDSFGASGRALLSPHLSNTQIRQAFQAIPLLRGYLHELPGMRNAMIAFDRGEIDETMFRRRLSANLFHNDGGGSDRQVGFWQTVLTARAVPEAITASQIPDAGRFFAGTVFEGATVDGVTRPRYPSPVTVEGFYHAILDRLSQGTRGGILKIFEERGGDSLEKLEQTLVVAPRGAVEQLESLAVTIRATSWLTPRQKATLVAEIERSIFRMRLASDYVATHVRTVRNDRGIAAVVFSAPATIPVRHRARVAPVTIVTGETSRTELFQVLSNFLRAEERAHGDPLQ